MARLRLFLIVALLLTLAACGDDADSQDQGSDETDDPGASEEEAEPDNGQAEDEEPADDEEATYEGETIRIVVGFSPGGGFDSYARLIARHLPKHIPGEPDVIVENMEGAGSLVAAEALYESLPADGTVIGHFLTGRLALRAVLDDPEVSFAPEEFGYLAAPTRDTFACAVRSDLGVESFEDLQDSETGIVLGDQGPADASTMQALQHMGVNLEIVGGYPGTSEIRLATEQAEVDGGCWSWETMRRDWADALEAGDVVPIGAIGEEPPHDAPDLPLLRDLARDEEELAVLVQGTENPAFIQRAFVTPPGTPSDRMEILRAAFDAVLEDPELLDEAAQGDMDITPVSAEEIEARVRALTAMPEDIRETLSNMYFPGG